MIAPVCSWQSARRVSALRATWGRASARQAQALEPAAPRVLGALAALRLGRGVGREAVAAAAQLDHVRAAALDVRARHGLHAVVLDLPLQAGGIQRDRVGRAEHDDAVGIDAQADGRAAEVGPRRELDDRLGGALEHAHEAHAPVGLAAVEVVAHRQPGPARLERERAVEVALRRRGAVVGRANRQRSPGAAAHELGEEGSAVGTRVAEPGDAGVRRHERDRLAVGEHRVALDRHGVGAGEPFAAALDEAREQARDVVGALDALRRERRARARP